MSQVSCLRIRQFNGHFELPLCNLCNSIIFGSGRPASWWPMLYQGLILSRLIYFSLGLLLCLVGRIAGYVTRMSGGVGGALSDERPYPYTTQPATTSLITSLIPKTLPACLMVIQRGSSRPTAVSLSSQPPPAWYISILSRAK